MSAPRPPAREHYDAIVDLGPEPTRRPYAFALVKLTYRITPRGWERVAPEPLLFDFRDERQQPRLVPGTDFFPKKLLTDVVVQGSAYAPRGVPVGQMTASVSVGGQTKRVAVFGRRGLTWAARGTPRFAPPEPFTEVPLDWTHAYGGLDWRVDDPAAYAWPPEELALALEVDHPGLYPRNPFGKGYLVDPTPVEHAELPQLEDPDDPLTPERVLVRDPRNWYRQPLPWAFEWVHPMMFPRYVFAVGPGADAWFPGPEDVRMPEVRRGFLVPGYRTLMEGRSLGEGAEPTFWQGASHGMAFDLPPEVPIRITGMHPEEERVAFQVPPAPVLVMEVEGRRERVAPRLHHVVCRPADKTFTVVYGATTSLPRPFIPGIHKHVPVAVAVNGDAPVRYEAPVPMRERLAEAMAQGRPPEP